MKAFTYGAACAALVGLVWAANSMVGEEPAPKSASQSTASVEAARASKREDAKLDPAAAREALKALALGGAEQAVKQPSLMSAEEIQAELTVLESDLEKDEAIARLNRDDVTEEERAEFGETLERVALLRHALAERDAELLVKEVDAYARIHAERVAQIMAESEADQ